MNNIAGEKISWRKKEKKTVKGKGDSKNKKGKEDSKRRRRT